MNRKRAPQEEPNADVHGVRGVRQARPPHADLTDPRDPAWDELVAAYRRSLLARARSGTAGPALPLELPGLSEELSSAAYRYSKGPDFTNDGLGYGEALEEQLWWVVEGGAVVSQRRTSQRTKTGKQLLRSEPVQPERASLQHASTPSAAPASPLARTLPEQASRPRKQAL